MRSSGCAGAAAVAREDDDQARSRSASTSIEQLGGALMPPGAGLGEHAVDDRTESGDLVRIARSRCRRIAQNRRHRLGRIVAEKRMAAGRELVQDHAEREDIGARIERGAEHLLGRHVGRCADPRAGVGEDGAATVVAALHCPAAWPKARVRQMRRHDLLGEAEVHDLHVPLRRHHHVGGLEVAMDDAAAMGGVERLGQLVRDVDHLAHGQQRAARGGVQRLALDVLHHDEDAAVGVADLVDLADEGMIERGGGERLAPQPLARDGVRLGRGRQQLDGDAALEARVLGEKHLAHAAGAERREDAVAAGEQVCEHEGGQCTSDCPER